jgi:hypothetical protein
MTDKTVSRTLQWSIIGSLLAVVIGIPAYQAIREAQTGTVPHLFRLFTTKPTKQALHAWDQENRDRSILAKAVRSKVLQLQYDGFGDVGAKAIQGRDGWLFYRPDVEYLMQPAFTDERFYLGTFDTVVAGKRENLRNPLAAIRDVNEQMARRGIKLVVVPIPGKPGIYPSMLSGLDVPIDQSPTLVLIDSLRRSGIATVDLVHAMRDARGETPVDLYLHRDTHWAPAGVDVAAAEISKALLSIPEIAANRDPSRYTLKDTAIERWGDICEMTSLPNRRSIWKTENVVAHQVRDSSGTAYRDTSAARVLWLGDSYSRIYQTDAPKAAGVIAQVARRIGQPLASIINDGGASTVVRRQLLRKPELLAHAKVVVWTFVERDIRFGEGGWALERLP